MPHKSYRKRLPPRVKELPIRKCLRENLRNRRVQQGMSQRELGERLGVLQQWIEQLEANRGGAVPSTYQIADLCLALSCSWADLFTPGKFKAGVGADDDMRTHQRRTR